ncbi:MAG: hypothetical protein F6K40_34720 [Okeania sp. SIO3I5]|nr:hypothetical protein [Okeania sp. SIO3I5]NEQ41090.1 hypothetical protein [Okeania sp. SIO3I5]
MIFCVSPIKVKLAAKRSLVSKTIDPATPVVAKIPDLMQSNQEQIFHLSN